MIKFDFIKLTFYKIKFLTPFEKSYKINKFYVKRTNLAKMKSRTRYDFN